MTWMLIWFNWSATTINDMLKILYKYNIYRYDELCTCFNEFHHAIPIKKKNPIILTKSKLISLSLCVCLFLKKKKKKKSKLILD